MAVPAVQVEIGEQEHHQRSGEDCLRTGAIEALGLGAHCEEFGEQPEVDAEIDQNGPGQRRRRWKDDGATHGHDHGQEHGQQGPDSHKNAAIQRQAVDLVLVDLGIPQRELWQARRTQLRDECYRCAWVENDVENIGVAALLALRAWPLAGRDRLDARGAEIGPD